MSDSAKRDAGKRRFGRSSATAVQDSSTAAGGENQDNVRGQQGQPASKWAETTTTMPAVGSGNRAAGAAPPPVDPYASTTVTPSAGPGPNRLDGAPSTAAPTVPGAAAPPPAAPKVARVPKRADGPPRRAKLQVSHLNVWSALKFACVLGLALFLVWMIVIAALYGLLDQMHVFSKVNETVQKINGSTVQQNYVTKNIVFGAALIIGLVNTVLFILLSTVGSVVYNLCADLVGGVEVTLSERE